MPKESPNLNKVTMEANGKIGGYSFQQDSISNQLAFAFGGPDGEKEAERIFREAQENFPQPVQMRERKAFIEEEVRKITRRLDEDFRKGLSEIFDFGKIKDKPPSSQDIEALNASAIALMKNLGLNIDPDNVKTHYDAGPPQLFQITFIIKPTLNLTNNESSINKLANLYANNCDLKTREEFNSSWKDHVQNAKSGGPKMSKEEFSKVADESFRETLAQRQAAKQDANVKMDSVEMDDLTRSSPKLN
ncbi:hypothetical protein [Legionella gresilensis]|uniref:hypothetical protein n=1 Tax=Legionella gresilensis TaxID=91823 RepID=UPI001040FD7F|nr:hypothetical protein [Legionella gresilensis]